MSRSLQLGLRTGDLFQTPSVPRSCSGIISKTDSVFYSRVSSLTYIIFDIFKLNCFIGLNLPTVVKVMDKPRE